MAARDGAAHLSLRSVAAEAGYAPAALYSYFRNKSELLLALAAEDQSGLSRKMRETSGQDREHRLAAAAAAAMPNLFAQQQQVGGGGLFYERGPVRIRYRVDGTGLPLLVLPGGGLNATAAFLTTNAPFNPITEFSSEYRCITPDLRNAPSGESTGPVEVDRPWDSYADDHLGLMDHLGIDRFMVMGFCIGGPFIWSLLKRAPNRIIAAVLAQPVGWRPEMRDPKYPGTFWKAWGATLVAKRPEISLQTTDQFVANMFEANPDRKSTRLNSSHIPLSRMPSSA